MANAVRTPEVIRMFASKQPASLRIRLAALSEDRKLGRITEDRFKCAPIHVLIGVPLTLRE
jgi:hypothetical protein